jgi:ribosomal protein S18 acetylase RimI-like enzyme
MPAHPLDNPIWASLTCRHRAFARRTGEAARYPADVAPFAGVGRADAAAAAALAALLAPGETVYLLGLAPAPPDAHLHKLADLAQMVCTGPMAEVAGPAIVELGEAQRADVLALAALVYPHYFRPRTMALGHYFGIYRDGRLAAMIGERMGTDDGQEISAVCTHPDFAGRGYARRLLARLSNDALGRGLTPFLHVSHDNVRAKALYERCGYRLRADVPFWSLRRAPA